MICFTHPSLPLGVAGFEAGRAFQLGRHQSSRLGRGGGWMGSFRVGGRPNDEIMIFGIFVTLVLAFAHPVIFPR